MDVCFVVVVVLVVVVLVVVVATLVLVVVNLKVVDGIPVWAFILCIIKKLNKKIENIIIRCIFYSKLVFLFSYCIYFNLNFLIFMVIKSIDYKLSV